MPRGRPRKSEDVACKCLQCGKEYAVPAWQGYGRLYCGQACYHASRVGLGAPWMERPREIKTCPICGTKFEVGGYGKPRKKRFCSPRCAGTSKWPPPLELSDTDAAYIAGFFDGEGNIKQHKPHGWRITIYQCDEAVIRWIQETTGTGLVAERTSSGKNLVKHGPLKQAWIWQLYGRNAAAVLRQLLPYLHVKRAQAEEMVRDLLG